MTEYAISSLKIADRPADKDETLIITQEDSPQEAATMEPVEARSSPCEGCNQTGRCTECGGTGRIEGEKCWCDDGQCLDCDGLGKTPDFYYKGSPVTFMVDFWWRMMLAGVTVLALGLMIMLTSLLAPGIMKWDFDPVWFAIPLIVMGAGFLAWSIRLWRLKMLVKEAEKTFYRMQSIGL